jgi:hypothetical protein
MTPLMMKFLKDTFKQNGYNLQFCRVINPSESVDPPRNKLDSVAFLSYVRKTLNHISRVLSWQNFKSVGLLLRKISGFLWLVKVDLELRIEQTVSPVNVAKSALERQAVCSIPG